MDAIEAILTRRSIRKYKTHPIPEEKVGILLKAAMYAPSARNTQSWHFIVADKREMLDRIMEFHPYAKMLAEAPLAIIVCGDKNLEREEAYICINCSAATQNILLAAHAEGLAAVWLGVYPRKQRLDGLISLFNLPENIIPVSIVAVGYPDEIKEQPDRYKKERVHYNGW